MAGRHVRAVRAYTLRGGADYHDQTGPHWIDDHVATPMARYPEYRASRRSFGLDVLGSLLVEVEADDGTVGVGITTGGVIGAWIVEQHLARFVEGAPVTDIERIWDQMFLSTLHYGRKGIVLNAISGVDLALWDLLGQLRDEPVHALLGGAVRDEINFYATGPDPAAAQRLGFIGCKVPLQYGPAEGDPGRRATVERLQAARDAVGEDFWLMLDCWMSLDGASARRLAHQLADIDLRWIEEPLLPDDYWGYAELWKALPPPMLLATGEHESTRWGFRLLVEMGCCDIVQPDIGWCGGLTELRRIEALAAAAGKAVVPHGSSVYSYHFVVTAPSSPFAEFLLMSPTGDEVVPMFSPTLVGEPVPECGVIKVSQLDRPGFGVSVNPDLQRERPYPRP